MRSNGRPVTPSSCICVLPGGGGRTVTPVSIVAAVDLGVLLVISAADHVDDGAEPENAYDDVEDAEHELVTLGVTWMTAWRRGVIARWSGSKPQMYGSPTQN